MKINGPTIELVSEDVRSVVKAYEAEKNSRARGVLWARELRGRSQELIHCANALGTVSGDLVVQRSLDLLKDSYPLLSRISTNCSEASITIGATVFTRLRSVPTTGDYDSETGYPTQDVNAVDVPVTVDKHKSVQHKFNANELSISGTRNLPAEQEEGMHAALAAAFNDALMALVTAENFPHSTVIALDDFNRRKVISIKGNFRARKVSSGTFTLLLNPDAHGELEGDSTIVSNLINRDAGDAIASGELPMVAKFQPFEATFLPDGLLGLALRSDALAIATRVPSDYASVFPGAQFANGLLSTVTQPETGLSVALCKFVDHKMGAAFLRIALLFGVAIGNPNCAQRLVP